MGRTKKEASHGLEAALTTLTYGRKRKKREQRPPYPTEKEEEECPRNMHGRMISKKSLKFLQLWGLN